MQKELRAQRSGWNIELIGLNLTNHASANARATTGRTLPWLQDRMEVAAWRQWDVVYRDVRILDPLNRLVGVFNLTTRNLLLPSNYDALKKMLLDAAVVVDSDQDRLPDAWEVKHFGHLGQGPREDSDLDGADNVAEWAHGTDPKSAASKPEIQLKVLKNGALNYLVATLRRPAPSLGQLSYETSLSLGDWTPGLARPILAVPDANLFDGSGCFSTSLRFDAAADAGTAGFFRIRLAPLP